MSYLVYSLNIFNVKRPCDFIIHSDRETCVVCDDMIMDCQDGFRVHFNPSNLCKKTKQT